MNRKTLNDNIKYSCDLLNVPKGINNQFFYGTYLIIAHFVNCSFIFVIMFADYNKSVVEKKYNNLRRSWHPCLHNNSSESEFVSSYH